MKHFLTFILALLVTFSAFAQAEKSIIIEQKSFRPVQTDALTGVNIDPIGLDYSKRPCARLKVKINRMTKAEIDGIEVKPITNNAVMKCKTAEYDNGLIIEMTAKPQTRFYFHHNEFGDSNEVIFDLEADKEYYLESYLNQTFSIIVNSNVAGAAVYIDDKYCGETSQNQSLTVKDVMIGSHTLQLEYGKIKHTQTIEVNSGSISFRQNVNIAGSKPQYVVFAVEPQNTAITIDGQLYIAEDGVVTALIENGTHTYKAEARGYHPQSGTFTVSGAKVELPITLKGDFANVTLAAENGADIYINDKKVGTTTWSGRLNSGLYLFEARKSGYRTESLSKQITSAEPEQSYSFPTLTPIYGSADIVSVPAMAEITIDGKSVGRTPLLLDNLLVGEHTLSISKAGYSSKSQKVTISEAQTASVNITLTKTASTNAQKGGITSAPYKVGDYYNDGVKEGVVFEVSADGKHGKIVSMTQSSKGLQWSSDEYEQNRRIGANSKTDGAYNMQIVEKIAGWQTKYPAFKWCADLGEGWYLPALEELDIFTLNNSIHDAVNRTLAEKGGTKLNNRGEAMFYWSSTEDNSYKFCALSFSMYDGGADNYNKSSYYGYVRAVATFKDALTLQTPTAQKGGDYYNDGNTQIAIDGSSTAEQLNKEGDKFYDTKDYNSAVQCYRKAAEQGYASAQYNLGYCYRKGLGVTQDHTEAVKWYRKAAVQGHVKAQCQLGYCYETGQGVTKDYHLAVRWYREAAEQGYATAQYNLGLCYQYSRGGVQGLADAIKWYRKAAAQGDENAKEKLRKLGY